MSMKPGATTCPPASRVRLPSRLSPTALMRSPVTATSARRPGAPLPSSTVPPRMTRSAVMGFLPGLGLCPSVLPARQVCPDSGVVRQVRQAPGAVGDGLVGEQPGPEPVLVAVAPAFDPELATARGLHEQEVDALGL